MTPDLVVSHHLDGFRSGTARFNAMLAERLGVEMAGLFDERVGGARSPLFSFKTSELPQADAERFGVALDGLQAETVFLFLHEYAGNALERRLIEMSQVVYCGNEEVHALVSAAGGPARLVWAPGLLDDVRPFPATELSIFSFGMAHKLRVDMFRRLRDLLEESGRSYALYLSHASHETSTLEEEEVVFAEMREVFPTNLYFLGHISDVAVFNQLRACTYFATFFPSGVRANNTSVASAMEHGAVVITNLDEHSPAEYRHMESVIDLARCDELPADPRLLERIRGNAREVATARSWQRLLQVLRG